MNRLGREYICLNVAIGVQICSDELRINANISILNINLDSSLVKVYQMV